MAHSSTVSPPQKTAHTWSWETNFFISQHGSIESVIVSDCSKLWTNGDSMTYSSTARRNTTYTQTPAHWKLFLCDINSSTHQLRWFTDWLSQVSKLLSPKVYPAIASPSFAILQSNITIQYSNIKIQISPPMKIYLSYKFKFKLLQVRYPRTLPWRFIFVFTFQSRFASFPEIVWHRESVPKSK